MKFFIHGNGDFAKEMHHYFSNIKYFNKYYRTELSIDNKKYINPKKIKCVGFSHTETLKDFNIKKIKKYPHLICSSKKQDVFEKYINDNNFKSLDYLLINTPIIKKNNHIGHGFIALYAYIANHIYFGNHVYIGPMNLIANRVKISDRCSIYQKNSIDRDVEIGENTIITVNVFINKGVKVGKNCLIGPNQAVMEDIPDNSFYINGKIIRNLKA